MPILRRKDAALHYQCLGEGEHVVLIHGLGANLAFWYMGIARALSRRYRVVMYDLRGHGRSSSPARGYELPDMASDLHAILEHVGVDRAHVVGHSFGARVALYYAMVHAPRLLTLTVADTQIKTLQPALRLREWPHWPVWKRELRSQGVDRLPSDEEYISFHLLAHFNQFAVQPQLGRPRTPAPGPSLKRRDMGRRGSLRWQQLMECTHTARELEEESQLTLPALRAISLPTLAMYGEYSHCLPSCWRLEQLLANCQVAVVPRAGHFHPAIRPRRFVRTLGRFLTEHPAASAPVQSLPAAARE